MDANAPWRHESFHATRRRSDVPKGGNHEWCCEIPLVAEGRVFGRIEFLGNETSKPYREIVMHALEMTAQIEKVFLENPNAKAEGEKPPAPNEPPYQLVKPGDEDFADNKNKPSDEAASTS